MGLLDPKPLPFDYDEMMTLPFSQRVQLLCGVWATQGFGTPNAVYIVYILKLLFYIGMWFFFCSFSFPDTEFSQWAWEPQALLKAILWTMVFEAMGMGAASGPLSARYFPPLGGILYFARPGTLKVAPFPKLPLLGGDTRNIVNVLTYLCFLGCVFYALCASTITQAMLWPIISLLLLLGLMDKTIFLAARSEHYLLATIAFLFPLDTISALKVIWFAIWFWAATSKLNYHFPSVVCVMISNSALIQSQWIRKKLYAKYPDDLRPGPLAILLAHFGTVLEYLFPLVLIFGSGQGMQQEFALFTMLIFHIFIIVNLPMAVPIEWNIMAIYGGIVLFQYYNRDYYDMLNVPYLQFHSPLLISILIFSLIILPILGNLKPKWLSFLLSMRYYAGNWAYGIWLFKKGTLDQLDGNITKTSPHLLKQLDFFYDKKTSEALLSRVIAFRMMHLQGRALHEPLTKVVDNLDDYDWRDGELLAGHLIGWNFGDGHLHSEQLLQAVQKKCQFESGDLRCIFVESQPFGKGYMEWRIVDAKDGLMETGKAHLQHMLKSNPWP